MVDVTEIKRKVCLIGDWGVGKTSLVRKYVLDIFSDDYLVTIGTKVYKKRVKVEENQNKIIDLNLIIWDIMGQKEFQRTQAVAFHGSNGAIIVCDITRKETLDSIYQWRNQLFNATSEIPIIILANKFDLQDIAQVTSKDLNDVAEELNSTFLFTSAKSGENVESAFQEIGRRILK